jgi:hypothetical protein
MEGRCHAGESLACFVAGRVRSTGGSLGEGGGPFTVLEERLGEIELEYDVQLSRPHQLERALQERGGGALIAPPQRAAPGSGQSPACPLRQLGIGLP